MLTHHPMDATEFVETVQPLLACRDVQGLKCLLQSRWTLEQIKGLLTGENEDGRKVAALSLALVGGKCCLGPLAQLLRDPDPIVNEMAEHALWSIWFRCGKSQDANHELCRGTKALNHRDFDLAIEHLTRAIDLDPTFAEAYNQRAIAHYLQERYDESIVDCLRAVERMPCHFARGRAWDIVTPTKAAWPKQSKATSELCRSIPIWKPSGKALPNCGTNSIENQNSVQRRRRAD